MTTVELFQALWDSRASFDGLHVVRDGDRCTVFDPTKYVTMRDLDNNYAVPPPARMLQLSASLWAVCKSELLVHVVFA